MKYYKTNFSFITTTKLNLKEQILESLEGSPQKTFESETNNDGTGSLRKSFSSKYYKEKAFEIESWYQEIVKLSPSSTNKAIIDRTLVQIDIFPPIQKIKKMLSVGLSTEDIELVAVNICNLSFKRHRVKNRIASIMDISLRGNQNSLPFSPRKEELKISTSPKPLKFRTLVESSSSLDLSRKYAFDPFKSFFVLTTQSIVRNSPFMNQLSGINYDSLYLQLQKEQIPFFKWQNWINATVHSTCTGQHRKSRSNAFCDILIKAGLR